MIRCCRVVAHLTTGKNFDADRKQWWCGLAKSEAAAKLVAGLNDPTAAPIAEDLGAKQVYAKVEYKGRQYYVIQETAGQVRCRLMTLDSTEPFWVDCGACKLVRTYPGREVWDGRRGNGTVTRYTTIGSLRDFRDDQKSAEKAGVPQCPVCGKRNSDMVRDLETGMTCCRGCCDMPSE